MKSFKKWLPAALILVLVLSVHDSASAASGSNVNVRYESRFASEYPERTPEVLIENGRVLLPLRDLASMLQLQVRWDNDRKVATFVQPGRELALSAATNEAVLNGRANWFDHVEGVLYRSVGAGKPVELGSFKVPAGSGTEPAFSSLEVEKASASNRRLDIHLTVHGAGAGEYIHVLHGLFLKDGQILHHAELEYSGTYPLQHVSRYDGYGVLSDGRLVRIVDSEGNIVKTHDLQALTGIEDRMMVERLTDRYLLARPLETPYLVLIDLAGQESFKLYRLFYSEEDQAASENVGYGSYEFLHYFDLRLEKEEGNTLYFTSRSIESGETRTFAYTIGH